MRLVEPIQNETKCLFIFIFYLFIFFPTLHRTALHRTAPHRTAPHRTAPHRTASESDGGNNELFTPQVDSSSIGTGTLKGLVPMADLVGYRYYTGPSEATCTQLYTCTIVARAVPRMKFVQNLGDFPCYFRFFLLIWGPYLSMIFCAIFGSI